MDIVDRIIEVVNTAINADPSAMRALFENRVPCNTKLANHPEIQILEEKSNMYTIGVMGLLSGIAGTCSYKGSDKYSKIWAIYEVKCPIHGVNEEIPDLVVGQNCPIKDCVEKLEPGYLLRLERVPYEEISHQ